MPFALSVICIC